MTDLLSQNVPIDDVQYLAGTPASPNPPGFIVAELAATIEKDYVSSGSPTFRKHDRCLYARSRLLRATRRPSPLNEFDILPSEKEFYEETYGELLKEVNDPSAGFLRHYINLYVEAFGKLSSELTEWLLEKQQDGRSRIPIAPYCYLVGAVEDKEAVVYFRAANSLLGAFNERIETERSLRYWSIAHQEDHSEERLRHWAPLSPGSIHFDPGTYHPEYYFAL